jgi:agmatinase
MDDELAFLGAHPEIGVHRARDVARRGAEAIANDVAVQLQTVDAVYVTLDIDALDPAYAPGTGIPEAGGLSTRELLEFLRAIFTELPVCALDIVEVAPPLDYADITAFAAAKVVYEVFGWAKKKTHNKRA